MKKEKQQFTLDELCLLVELPKRTVRFYMQHNLVDRPEGSGRGAHYTAHHVDQLLTVRKWKQAGLSLERIGELVGGAPVSVPPPPTRPGQIDVWSRIHLADGVEFHIEPKRAGLTPEQLRALVQATLHAYQQIQQEEDRK